jgi:hypothetical protein
MTGIKLLGFKDRSELRFEDNIKHSHFIYPDELVRHSLFTSPNPNPSKQKFSGSKRTFSALVKTMLTKQKIGLVLALTRRNASPVFCALLPQVTYRSPYSVFCIAEAHANARQKKRMKGDGTNLLGSISFRSPSRTISEPHRSRNHIVVRSIPLHTRVSAHGHHE